MYPIYKPSYVGAALLTKYFVFNREWKEVPYNVLPTSAYQALRRALKVDIAKGPMRDPAQRKIVASSQERYRASASERRMYGGSTVTRFFVFYKDDEDDPNKWLMVTGYGPTPGERKTDAIRRAVESGLLGTVNPAGGVKRIGSAY